MASGHTDHERVDGIVERTTGATTTGRTHWGQVTIISLAHFAHDIYTALLSPWLPLLIRKLALSKLQAGSLSVFLQVATFFNPFIGGLVDRRNLVRLLVVVSPTVTAAGMSLVGLAPSYGALALLLLVTGLGVAGIHVSTPVAMAHAAGPRTGLGMSFHMLGGELARTLGPIVAVQAVAWWGIEGSWRLFPGGLAASLLLWWKVRDVRPGRARQKPTGLFVLWRRTRGMLLAVTGLMSARQVVSSSLTTFLPTFLVEQGAGLWMANIALSVFEAAAAVGVLAAGAISDRLGRTRVVLAATLLAPPLMAGFLLASGVLKLVLLALLGAVILSLNPVIMALMIETAGEDRAAANGTFMMIMFLTRSLLVPAVGALADVVGLERAYWVCAGLSLSGIFFALLLRREVDGHQ